MNPQAHLALEAETDITIAATATKIALYIVEDLIGRKRVWEVPDIQDLDTKTQVSKAPQSSM